jgi:hypothetical protein
VTNNTTSQGLLDSPLFSMHTLTMEATGSKGSNNFESGQTTGSSGTCPVLKNGSFFSAECEAKINFGCEEKKPPPGGITTKYA